MGGVTDRTLSKEVALAIDCVVGVVGVLLSLGWGKATGRTMDKDTKKFLAYIWGGIAAFGIVMVFVM